MFLDRPDILTDTGPHNAVSFALDGSFRNNIFQFKEYLPPDKASRWNYVDEHSYDVVVTPRGHFAVDRTATERNSVVRISTDATDFDARYQDVSIMPTYMVKTTEEFRAMSADKRECFYSHEKELDYFPEYSESNCKLECAWSIAMDKCGCVPWFLLDLYPSSPICDIFGNLCFKGSVDRRYRDSKLAKGDDDPASSCYDACLDDCETVDFRLELHEVRLRNWRGPVWYCLSGEFFGTIGDHWEVSNFHRTLRKWSVLKKVAQCPWITLCN